MAIQNFISGGFYGKIGDLVGQRWRNKRIVRRHVIGKNPRTELQQQNRSLFAQSVSLAQSAMNINKGAPAWSNPSVGEFSWRVGTAKSRLQQSLSLHAAFPLFPDNYVPSHTFTALSLGDIESRGRVILRLSPAPSVINRAFSVAFYALNLLSGSYSIIYNSSVLSGPSPAIFDPCYPPYLAAGPDSWVAGATIDDSKYSDTAYFLPRQPISEPLPIRRFYVLEFLDIDISNSYIDIYYYCPFIPFEEISPIPITAYCLVDGVMQDYENIGQLRWMEEHDWQINIAIPDNVKFPAGSVIYGIDAEIEREYYNQYVICYSYEIED